MIEWELATLIALIGAGLAAILLTPREKKKKNLTKKDEFEGLDDYAVLLILTRSGRARDALKRVKQLLRKETNAGRRRLLEKVLDEVKKVG
ncbi:MAG: hypothetical protein RMI49_03980 [Candidatus Caldarchaeum sp.]|nr:hypothetical protein [Candidatus Caldarchaeum sp.]